jgi:hypothetical protein
MMNKSGSDGTRDSISLARSLAWSRSWGPPPTCLRPLKAGRRQKEREGCARQKRSSRPCRPSACPPVRLSAYPPIRLPAGRRSLTHYGRIMTRALPEDQPVDNQADLFGPRCARPVFISLMLLLLLPAPPGRGARRLTRAGEALEALQIKLIPDAARRPPPSAEGARVRFFHHDLAAHHARPRPTAGIYRCTDRARPPDHRWLHLGRRHRRARSDSGARARGGHNSIKFAA